MTGIDGSETTAQLRQQKHLMSIIILSANAYSTDRIRAMDAGASDFLAKPIQVQNLLNKLKLHLGLNWVFQADNTENSTQSIDPPQTRPNDDIIAELMHFIRIGDLLGLTKKIDHLSSVHPEYTPYFNRIKYLAKDFRIGEIKKLLT